MPDDLKSLTETAKQLHCHPGTLRQWAKAGIVPHHRIGKKYFFDPSEIHQSSSVAPTNQEEIVEIKKITQSQSTITISNGVIMVKLGTHPMANKNGYAPLHHIIMQAVMGRTLEKGEIVHYKNGNTLDNRIENLELYNSLGAHNKDKKFLREDTNV